MTASKCRGVLLAGACLWVVASATFADQTDPRLDALFGELADAPNAHQASQAEQRIWKAWFNHADERASHMLQDARDRAQAGALDAAEVKLDQLVDEVPAYAEAWNQRAIVRYLRGDIEGSLADIERTIALEPRHFGALSGRGQCYLQLERYQEALRAFEEALSLNPWIASVRNQVRMLRSYLERNAAPAI